MAIIRLAPEAESELDDIWLYIVRGSGYPDIANRVVDGITERFWLLARYPFVGRERDTDLGPGLRRLPCGNYIVIYRVESEIVLILHIVPAGRDISALFA